MNAHQDNLIHTRDLLAPAGILLLLSGASVLLDRVLQTGWLSYSMVALAGLLIMGGGLLAGSLLWALGGGLLAGLGIGAYFLLQAVAWPWNQRLGGFVAAFGLGWLLVFLLMVLGPPRLQGRQSPWWTLVPGSLSTALGACFLFSSLRVADFILYLGVGLALALLAWGVHEKWIGLVIPGCLALGASSGVYLGWGQAAESGGLAQTGIMLVFFGLGWLLITLFSRLVTNMAIWWPLIPGGILATVGWGLYIGGNPNDAFNFISNTGSIALTLFGLYLLLLRRGIR